MGLNGCPPLAWTSIEPCFCLMTEPPLNEGRLKAGLTYLQIRKQKTALQSCRLSYYWADQHKVSGVGVIVAFPLNTDYGRGQKDASISACKKQLPQHSLACLGQRNVHGRS